jgi:hypothetical protein
MTSHLYDGDEHFPPAPVLEISIGKPGEQAGGSTFLALVDTGADATIIPVEHLAQNRAQKVDQSAALRSHWGERRLVALYAVAMGIGPYQFPAIQVVGDEVGNEVVLGRNVLNRLRLLLDGPAGVTEILEKI